MDYIFLYKNEIALFLAIIFAIYCISICIIELKKENRKTKLFNTITQQKKDLRTNTRRNNPSSVRVFLQTPKGEMMDCYVADWSVGGLGIFASDFSEWRLYQGLRLAIKSPSNFLGPWIPIEVRYFRKDVYGWFIGCKFAKETDADTLKGFISK